MFYVYGMMSGLKTTRAPYMTAVCLMCCMMSGSKTLNDDDDDISNFEYETIHDFQNDISTSKDRRLPYQPTTFASNTIEEATDKKYA